LLRAVSIAPLPRSPAIVEGVINVRGTLVPVLDIRKRFGLPASEVAPSNHLILAEAGGRKVALRVDRAHELVTVDSRDIVPADASIAGEGVVSGMARLPDGVLVIHDLERFLSLDERKATELALAEARA
jgi:purine-binding chemotaxis protein CheW